MKSNLPGEGYWRGTSYQVPTNNEDSESDLPKDNEVGGLEDDESDSDELPSYQVPVNSQNGGPESLNEHELCSYKLPAEGGERLLLLHKSMPEIQNFPDHIDPGFLTLQLLQKRKERQYPSLDIITKKRKNEAFSKGVYR